MFLSILMHDGIMPRTTFPGPSFPPSHTPAPPSQTQTERLTWPATTQLGLTHRKHSDTKVEKKALLKLLREKLDGDFTASEVDEPLEYSHRCKTSAVLVATSAIDINGIKVTKLASKVLAKHAGLSLDSLSHWALVVVDRGDGASYLYDLMSDRKHHHHRTTTR